MAPAATSKHTVTTGYLAELMRLQPCTLSSDQEGELFHLPYLHAAEACQIPPVHFPAGRAGVVHTSLKFTMSVGGK